MNTTTNTRVSEAEDGASVLQRLGDDAAKWAAEFRATALRLGYSDMDEGWLIGWFANAIEHSGDVRRWRKEAALSAPEPAAQGEVIYVNAVDDDGALLYVHPPIAKRGDKLYTAPPAQPAERVPDARIIDLAERLVASGPKAAHVSASECHEISDFILSLASPAPSEGGKGVEG